MIVLETANEANESMTMMFERNTTREVGVVPDADRIWPDARADIVDGLEGGSSMRRVDTFRVCRGAKISEGLWGQVERRDWVRGFGEMCGEKESVKDGVVVEMLDDEIVEVAENDSVRG